MITQRERDWAKNEERFRAELEARSFQKIHEATGIQKGLAKGGLIGRIQLSQKLLQQPQTPEEELLGLPIAELERLADLLEQQAVNNLRPPNVTP